MTRLRKLEEDCVGHRDLLVAIALRMVFGCKCARLDMPVALCSWKLIDRYRLAIAPQRQTVYCSSIS